MSCMAIATAGVLLSVYSNKNQVLFTCTGTYQADIQLRGDYIVNNGNISISVSNSHKIYMNIDARVNINNESHHLGRDIIYHYEAVDQKNGLFRLNFIDGNRTASDTLDKHDITPLLFSMDKDGRIIKVLRVNEKVLLIGNPFTPLYSCTILN